MNFIRLKGKKIQTNVTLDEELVKKLHNLREKWKVRTLSPFINEILWDWLDTQEKKTK